MYLIWKLSHYLFAVLSMSALSMSDRGEEFISEGSRADPLLPATTGEAWSKNRNVLGVHRRRSGELSSSELHACGLVGWDGIFCLVLYGFPFLSFPLGLTKNLWGYGRKVHAKFWPL